MRRGAMNRLSVKQLVTMALLTGLVAVSTMVIQIPTIATAGFINFGDAMIFLSAVIFGPVTGFVAGGVGSALADVLTGYGHWAPFTLVIKSLEGLLCGYLFLMLSRIGMKKLLAAGLSMTVAGTWMVIGYFFGAVILKGSAAIALTSVPGNIVQAVGSLILGLVLLLPLERIIRR